MTQKIKIGITGVNPFSGNRGVGALAISAIYLLNKIAEEKNCTIEITAINPNYGKHLVQLGNKSINLNNILPVNIFSCKNILRLLVKPKEILSFFTYPKFDYILCMGEGDSFSDIYGKRRFSSIDGQHRMARLFGKKYLLLPQTIGPFDNPHIKKQARKSLENAQLVFARDMQSFSYVIENTAQKNVFEAIDVAFFMPYEKQTFSNDFIHIGINISALLWNGGYTRNNQFGLKSNYQELIRGMVEYFLSIPDVKIHIVPHVVLVNSSIENDYEVSYNLVEEYRNDRIILAPFFLTPILAKNYIAGMDFFAGARMHATIAAFSSGVPVYPMAYSRKFNGLFMDTLDYKYMGDMVNEEMEAIKEGIKDAYNQRLVLKEIIGERLAGVVEERRQLLLENLKKFLEL